MTDKEKIKKMQEDLFVELYYERNISLADLKKATKNLPGMEGCTTKESHCKALASFVFNEELFSFYINSLSPVHMDFFRKCVYSWGLRFSDYAAMFNITLPEIFYYHYGYNLKNSNLPFVWCLDYDEDYIYMGPVMKSSLVYALSSFGIPIQTVDEQVMRSLAGYFSEAQGLEFYNNAISIFYVLKNAGFFERKTGLSIVKTIRQKVNSIVTLSPFITAHKAMQLGYTLEQAEKLEKIRTDLCLSFLSACFSSESNSDISKVVIPSDPLEFYKFCLKEFFESSDIHYSLKYLIPHIKINHKDWHIDEILMHQQENAVSVLTMFKTWTFSEPVLFSDFLDYAQTLGFPSLLLPEMWYCCTMYVKYNKGTWFLYKRATEEASDFREMVYEPSYTNLIFLFAALGLFEITWEKPFADDALTDKDYEAQNKLILYPFGKISSFYMTNLGKAVFGITDTFDNTAAASYNPPELFEDDTLVRIDAEDRVMHLFLEQFCSKVGTCLYKADLAKISVIARNPERLQTMLKSLSDYAKRPLPSVWENVRKKTSQKNTVLKVENTWVVISLAEHTADVIETVLKVFDAQGLRYRRMEGTCIAVDEKQLYRVKGSLEDNGIIVRS